MSDSDYEFNQRQEINTEVTPEKLFKVVSTAWLNESLSPEVLPHCGEMLDLMLGQLAHMENNLRELDQQDFRVMIHLMELERMKYLVASYLRCRLVKIEEFTNHILDEEANRTDTERRLSDSELRFAKDYREILEHHLFQVATKHMPVNLQQNDIEHRTIKPNLMSYVVIQVNSENAATIVGMDDEEISLASDTLHILPYQLVADLLQTGGVKLI